MNIIELLDYRKTKSLKTFFMFKGYQDLNTAIKAGRKLKLKNNFAIVDFLNQFYIIVYDTSYKVFVIGQEQVWIRNRIKNNWELHVLNNIDFQKEKIKQLTRNYLVKDGVYQSMMEVDFDTSVYLFKDNKWENTKHFKYVQTYIDLLGTSLLAHFNMEEDMRRNENNYIKNTQLSV